MLKKNHHPGTLARLLLAGTLLCSCIVFKAAAERTSEDVLAGVDGAKDADQQARDMLRRGERLLESGELERGVNLLSAIPLNFPDSTVRFAAYLALGRYYIEENNFQLAARNLLRAVESEETEITEEAYFRLGVAWYQMGDFGRAFSALRRVTEDYSWSEFANEAYYYIGKSHFRLSNWSRAVEAFRMVGTTVPPNLDEVNLVESGERFYIKIQDKDLRVLERVGEDLDVRVRTSSGDEEVVRLKPFDAEGEYYFGYIDMEQGEAAADDGVLQVKGGDEIVVEYIDRQTASGESDKPRVARSRLVSTARAGFMDGAFREYVEGVFEGQTTFIQVMDHDASVSPSPDTVNVVVSSRFIPRPEGLTDEEAAVYMDAEAEEQIRDTMELTLTETGPHTGRFTARLLVAEDPESAGDSRRRDIPVLKAAAGDDIVLEYLDEEHIEGLEDPRMRKARAVLLTGQIQDVRIVHREVDSEILRARKNLLEARTYLRLAEIFKDVGLFDRASENADIGIEKIDDIIRRSLRVSIDQDMVHEAYRVKWELMLAKGDLQGAISVSREMLALFPTSSLVDVAFMQIARAKIEGGRLVDAEPILRGLLNTSSDSEIRAEAQFMIGQIREQRAEMASGPHRRANYATAIAAYQEVVDNYPRSPYAGEALSKVIDFQIDQGDYSRSVEMLETVFMDYPDGDFLDGMLFKWAVVLVRMSRPDEALGKVDQLVLSYPESPYVDRGQQLARMLRQHRR